MSHEIRIFVVNGELQYIHHDTGNPNSDDPGNPLQLPPGEVVKWKCRDGDFTIDFATSPFTSGDTHIAGAQGKLEPKKGETLIDPGPLPAFPDFKYTVTVVGLPPDDPDIIIDNSGGGGRAKKTAKKKATAKAKAKK